MKTLLLSISLFLYGTGTTSAQQQDAPKANLTEEVRTLCNLTPEQVAKVQVLVGIFEKKRDETYNTYSDNLLELKHAAKQNIRTYEIWLIGILTPEQMGLVKAFDQLNMELLSGRGQHVHRVNYLCSDGNATSMNPYHTSAERKTEAKIETEDANDLLAEEQKARANDSALGVIEKSIPEISLSPLTEQIQKLCELVPDQIAQVQPIVADFEARRDADYWKYHNEPAELKRVVKANTRDFEESLADIISEEQMTLLKAFDRLNPELMTGNIKPDYEPLYVVRSR
jgi:hypothetical protein